MDSTVLVIAGGAGLVFVMICGALILKLRDLDILRREYRRQQAAEMGEISFRDAFDANQDQKGKS